eukprot:1207758-Amphidinium_carterae.1
MSQALVSSMSTRLVLLVAFAATALLGQRSSKRLPYSARWPVKALQGLRTPVTDEDHKQPHGGILDYGSCGPRLRRP